jgi:hypothetical protein
MNCATHPDIAAVAFCRTCGKPLCSNCTRDVRGVVYCEPCLAARLEGTVPPAPGVVPPAASYPPPASGFVPPAQAAYPPVGTPVAPLRTSGGPNPAVAGILAGFFPFGVGAVYCSQYAKGLAHLLIFSLLVFGSDHAGSLDWLFGLAIAFFYVFQIIDAVRTAKALQMGLPAPDPLGIGQTFGAGEKVDVKKVPIGAIVLIGLGALFLLHTAGFFEFGVDRFWPIILIVLGIWLFAKSWGLGSYRPGCLCERCRTRKLMGPALLVTLGVLFLLNNISNIGFHRTWPAILLVIGAVKLMQNNASSAGHIGPLPPGAGPCASPNVPPIVPPPSQDPTQPTSSGEVKNV